MREAVIVSTARTPIGKAYRGAFNDTESPSLAALAISAAVERAGLEGAEIDDVILGCAMQQGTQFPNIARLGALAAGFPATVAGMSIDRQCSSGLMAVATAIRPEEHWRSIDIPATVAGNPAARAPRRAMLGNWVPCCMAHPKMTSSISAPSNPARSTAAEIARAASEGDSVSLNAPR